MTRSHVDPAACVSYPCGVSSRNARQYLQLRHQALRPVHRCDQRFYFQYRRVDFLRSHRLRHHDLVSRRAGRVGWDIDPVRDTGFETEGFRVEHHTVVDILVEVDRIASGVEVAVDHTGSVGRRWVIGLDIHLGWVVECRSGRESRLVEGGSLAVGRREDSPAVLDCSNSRQTFYFTRKRGCSLFEKESDGIWGGLLYPML